MYCGWTEYAVLWTHFLGFIWVEIKFPRFIITEFECKVDVQNYDLGGYVFRIGFLKLLNNDDEK